MVVRQSILSTIMQKNVKLFYGNVRLHLATPEIVWARNLESIKYHKKKIMKTKYCHKYVSKNI